MLFNCRVIGTVSFYQNDDVAIEEHRRPSGIQHPANDELLTSLGAVAMIKNNHIETELRTSPHPMIFTLQQRKILIPKKPRWISFGTIIDENPLLRIEKIGQVAAGIEVVEDRTAQILPSHKFAGCLVSLF